MSMNVRDRKVVVLGLGVTGLSAARWAARRGARVTIVDPRADPPNLARAQNELPHVTLRRGPLTEGVFAGADLVVLSPGLAREEPAIAAAIAAGVDLVGDVEVFARALPLGQRVIAVTGSNGKTTVSALTGALLRAAGISAPALGNIGEPVLDALEAYERGARWPDAIVLELSSFQLETLSSLRPTAATVLNVTPNHLDRYADLAAYARAKARILDGALEALLNRDDPLSMSMRRPDRTMQTFGSGAPQAESEWGIARHSDASWLARGGALIAPVNELTLVGHHNALNALAALALCSTVVKIDRNVISALLAFRGLQHRMERVAEIGGVLYVNDSKATTVAATLAALEGLGRPAVLIAGGDGKGQEFSALKGAVERYCRAVVLLGRDAPQIAVALAGVTPPVDVVADLEAAVVRAIGAARDGDCVLLSPACASLDMFRDYIERGERFKALVIAHAREAAHA